MFSAFRYRFGKDGISVKIKENKEVIIFAELWYKKLTCLISTNFSIDGLKISISVMTIKNWYSVCFCVVAGYNII